ncbi:MAG: hypothetical protein AB7J13_06960 [Pyrinomonadaceae bacterium]
MKKVELLTEPRNSLKDFVNIFIQPAKQSRYLELISHEKGLAKFSRLLDHAIVQDLSNCLLIPPTNQNIEHISQRLIELGAENKCIVISSNNEINGEVLEIRDALGETIGYGFGTLLFFPSARIAYYESEERNCRYILKRS